MLHSFRDCAERTISRFGPANNGFERQQLRLVYISAFRVIGGKKVPIAISAWT
jgi:hypothetical protein